MCCFEFFAALHMSIVTCREARKSLLYRFAQFLYIFAPGCFLKHASCPFGLFPLGQKEREREKEFSVLAIFSLH